MWTDVWDLTVVRMISQFFMFAVSDGAFSSDDVCRQDWRNTARSLAIFNCYLFKLHISSSEGCTCASPPTWTDEGCIAGSVLDGGVSAVKLTQLSWPGRGGEWDTHMPSPVTVPGSRETEDHAYFHTLLQYPHHILCWHAQSTGHVTPTLFL